MAVELWCEVEDYPNYMVSNMGKVKNVRFGRILKPAKISKGYLAVKLRENKKPKSYLVHRLVANAFLDPPDDEHQVFVDHKNNEKLDNNVGNLRWATHKQNSRNKQKKENASSRYKGCTWNKNMNKWQSYIRVDDRLKHLGLFDDEKEAASKYNEYATRYFGQYAKLNEISDSDEDEDDNETDDNESDEE